jgi:hypothetical protein
MLGLAILTIELSCNASKKHIIEISWGGDKSPPQNWDRKLKNKGNAINAI